MYIFYGALPHTRKLFDKSLTKNFDLIAYILKLKVFEVPGNFFQKVSWQPEAKP